VTPLEPDLAVAWLELPSRQRRPRREPVLEYRLAREDGRRLALEIRVSLVVRLEQRVDVADAVHGTEVTLRRSAVQPLRPEAFFDPETVEEARANPDVLAKKTLKKVADHTADVIGKLEKKPAVVGHSTGGLFAQMLAGRGLSAATVAIDPGVFRGVLAAACGVKKVGSGWRLGVLVDRLR